MTVTCRHCGRRIVNEDGIWVDPEATGDDSVWRETCEAHDTFTAEHEPELADALFDQLAAKLGGEVTSRQSSVYNITTTYRWPNTPTGNMAAEVVREVALDSASRSAGAIGGQGSSHIILIVSKGLPA